jgi:hypothetical protein
VHHQMRISEETMSRLRACAQPFVDKEPEDVVRRLLDEHEGSNGKQGSASSFRPQESERASISRLPRERGIVVQIEGHQIRAVSVSDLYKQSLKLFVDRHKSALEKFLPFSTSDRRYLVARDAVHPGGNPFVVPVEYHGYHMEAHKDYKNAVEHLRKLAKSLGLETKYLG